MVFFLFCNKIIIKKVYFISCRAVVHPKQLEAFQFEIPKSLNTLISKKLLKVNKILIENLILFVWVENWLKS
jgi:hypothetical protein